MNSREHQMSTLAVGGAEGKAGTGAVNGNASGQGGNQSNQSAGAKDPKKSRNGAAAIPTSELMKRLWQCMRKNDAIMVGFVVINETESLILRTKKDIIGIYVLLFFILFLLFYETYKKISEIVVFTSQN